MKRDRRWPTAVQCTRRTALRWMGLVPLACGWGVASTPAAQEAQAAQERWPTRRIRLLVAYPAGGVSDRVGRSLAEQLSSRLAVPVVVENLPGAGGRIAMDVVARSRPDGHTLGFAAATAVGDLHRAASGTRLPSTPACPEPGARADIPVQAPSDAGRDTFAASGLAPVAGVMTTPVLIAGTSALAARTFTDMLNLARAAPDGLRWATTGEGTTGHAVLEQVSRLARVRVVHVPYKGGGRQIADAIAGHFELVSTNVAEAQLRAVDAGQLRALAVGSPVRVPALPDTPTLGELGFGPANLDSLFGLFAPPRTPPDIVRRLHAAVHRTLTTDPLAASLEAMSNRAFTGSTQDFAAEVRRRAGRFPPC